MSLYDHARFKVVQKSQHLYSHALEEFLFSHPALPPDAINIQDALSYILEVLYPRIAEQVATPADLPTGVDAPNVGDQPPSLFEQRLVADDGDGKAAIYMFYKMDGQPAAQWNKVGDLDYGANTVIQGLLDQTQYLFVRKFGSEDYDPSTELPLTGIDAGQHIYGGIAPNQNLTLHPTNGDDPANNTGFVQVNGEFRPYDDLTFSSGTPTERWLNIYAGTAIIGTGTMTITSDGVTGLITDTSGQISFGDENLLTTGNVNAAIVSASSSLTVNDGVDSLTIGTSSIESDTGALSFGANNLSTTGTVEALSLTTGTLTIQDGSIIDTDGLIGFGATDLSTTGDITAETAILGRIELDTNIVIDGTTISTLAGPLNLNGFTVVDIQSAMNTLGITATGIVDVTGSLVVDNVTIDGSSITEASNLLTVDSLLPAVDDGRTLGNATFHWGDLFFKGDIRNATDNEDFSNTDLFRLSRVAFRDVAKTQPAQDGDALFYNAASGKWLASTPDTEIDHGLLAGLADDDHTQYVKNDGRAGGQSLIASGDGFGNLLIRQSLTSVSGFQFSSGALVPISYDSKPDLGIPLNEWANLYMEGQAFGLRAENTTNPAGLFDAADIGRMAYNTTDEFLYVNTGTAFKRVGNNSHNQTYTEVQLASPIDVSGDVSDARNCIWQLIDIGNNEEIMAVPIRKTATLVTIANSVPLPAGTYRLLGIEL